MPPQDLLRALENKSWEESRSTVILSIMRNAEDAEENKRRTEAVEKLVTEMKVQFGIIVSVASFVASLAATAIFNALFGG